MKYVVAVNQKEADDLAKSNPELIHHYKEEAEWHLEEVKAPPTDPFYAAQYKIWTVK